MADHSTLISGSARLLGALQALGDANFFLGKGHGDREKEGSLELFDMLS